MRMVGGSGFVAFEVRGGGVGLAALEGGEDAVDVDVAVFEEETFDNAHIGRSKQGISSLRCSDRQIEYRSEQEAYRA
jgi:hypothetical protein